MAFLRRKRKKGIFRTLRFYARLRRNTEAVLSKGNRVELFPQGGDFFPALFRAFSSAATSICVEFYTIKDDLTGKAFAAALAEAASRGVRVSLIYDYIGCLDTPASYFRRLERVGVRCLPFNRPAFRRLHWLDKRDHRKVAVIDGKTAFLGSLNIGDEYAGYGENTKRWRDVGLRLDGPSVAELMKIFRLTWEKEDGNPADCPPDSGSSPDACGDDDVMIVNGTPHHNRSLIRSAFRMAMAGASDEIRIITPYFIPGPRVVRSLLRASARGVKIQIMLPSISDVPVVKLASRAYLTPLLKAGIEIYEREGTILHAKVMLVDDCWVTLGSANFDYRSFHRNHEVNVIVDSREFASQVERMFAEDLAKSRRVNFSEYQKRGLFERFLERLCDPISRFL
ncbi:MAG TPA: phospholipase D-like domain-containing protein [Geobacteraceae bacterium]|nr:phospholipase D-like domain-containing protein [Geobacteraceae bacterium]